jgi:hypothetical protein
MCIVGITAIFCKKKVNRSVHLQSWGVRSYINLQKILLHVSGERYALAPQLHSSRMSALMSLLVLPTSYQSKAAQKFDNPHIHLRIFIFIFI